jgi:alanyl-tRNA synthetase
LAKKLLAVKKARVAEAAAAAQASVAAAADAAAAAGAKHLVQKLDLPASVAGKAMQEAYARVKAAHPALACLLLAPDAEAERCAVYTEVPKGACKALPASEWLKCAVGVMGGKGGGKPERAMGSAPDVAKVDDAVAAANEFAAMRLSEA